MFSQMQCKLQVIDCTFPLPTGHNRMNAYLFNKMKIGTTGMHPCGTAQMTREHRLPNCPLHDTLRHAAWRNEVSQRDKLYHNLTAPEHTATFTRAARVFI